VDLAGLAALLATLLVHSATLVHGLATVLLATLVHSLATVLLVAALATLHGAAASTTFVRVVVVRVRVVSNVVVHFIYKREKIKIP